ncbi:thiol:disulfide interchange protein DsbA/DsbL [Pseudomonas chlororaphis]|uniref:thiol:disulfide interchange protein DsbA/DsbL n=1 Tax=Pseudomonas chlororaphis TaxID=587753 RepID=UPI0030D3F7F6
MRKFLLMLLAPALLYIPLGMAESVVSLQVEKDYRVISGRLSHFPKVLEFFSYACIHCKELDPSITQWASEAGDSVLLTRVPVTFGNKKMKGYTKAFYVGEALGLQTVTHRALFQLMEHGGKLESDQAIADFFAGLSVPRETTKKKLNSFAVQYRIAQGEMLAHRYKIRSVPSFVVNNKYYTDPSMLGSPEAVPAALTQLTTLHD